MEKFFILGLIILSLLSFSCNNDDKGINFPPTAAPLTEIPEPVGLNMPEIIQNDLAKGTFNNGIIKSVYCQTYNWVEKLWEFEIDENQRIKTIHYDRLTTGCEITTYHYTYTAQGLIDSVVYIRENYCNDFTSKWVYKYNYVQGALKNISGKGYFTDDTTVDKLISFSENYFSYYPNGTISDIYSHNWQNYETSFDGYRKISLKYDSNDNVIECITPELRLTYEYDTALNPYKGIFVMMKELATLPHFAYECYIAPGYLSNNCLKSAKRQYLGIPNSINLNYQSVLNGSVVTSYGTGPDDPNWINNTITYY